MNFYIFFFSFFEFLFFVHRHTSYNSLSVCTRSLSLMYVHIFTGNETILYSRQHFSLSSKHIHTLSPWTKPVLFPSLITILIFSIFHFSIRDGSANAAAVVCHDGECSGLRWRDMTMEILCTVNKQRKENLYAISFQSLCLSHELFNWINHD